MKYVKYALHKCCWLFVPASIRRTLLSAKETQASINEDAPQTPVLIGLAPNQFKALKNMYKYAPAEQVRDLLSVYESANKENPVNPQTAVWVSKQDIMAPKPNLRVLTR
ncbi:MAG: hypothetical protein IKY98_03220 [Alphaproteobacteria bacterium]|nr:hypothetical protein [Alphaproteobacteria bacterium]